jgi:hypothetical protein
MKQSAPDPVPARSFTFSHGSGTMAKTLRRMRTAAFGAGVGAAMLFGATAVRAEVRPSAACGDPFANGSCTTTTQCAKYCRGTVGAGTGQCSSGCCYCIWF